jgi:hypothetical protein
MDLWTPPHDAPHLLEWWRPLMLVSRRARLDRFPWPVHLDEFRLAGRVVRRGRPDIWIYEHHENGGSVCVDAAGATYRFTATPRGPGAGRFTTCEVRTALWRARLPEVVAPVWYDERRPDAPVDERDGSSTADGGEPPAAGAAEPPAADPSPADPAAAGADVDQAGAGDAGDDADKPGYHADGGQAGPPRDGRSPARLIRRGHLTLIAG